MRVQATMTHRNHILGRILQAGEIVELDESVVRANQALYIKAEGEMKRQLSKEEAIRLIIDNKLAKHSEVEGLSLKQLRELAEGVF